MLTFEVNGKKGNKVLTFPTSLNEITPEYLTYVTENINIANNYSLVALCHKEKLSSFIMAGRNNKTEMSTAVVPILAKKGNITSITQNLTENDFNNNISIGQKLIIAPSNLAMGVHVNVPKNTLTMGTLLAFIDGDGYAYQHAAKHTEDVYFVEFKLLPNCNIHAAFDITNTNTSFKNPFEVKEADNTNVE